MKTLRVGIAGAGSISDFHLRAYRKNPCVNLVAICDADRGRAQKKAAEFAIPHVCSSHEELLARGDVDAVSVATWNSTHEAITVAALQAGLHVLCEKPPALNAQGALRMQAAAQRSGKLLMFGFVRRFGRSAVVLKDLIDAGRLGFIYHAKAGSLRRCGNPGGWFADKAISGGGPLIDLGIHILDLSLYLMGKPRPVSVTGTTHSRLGARPTVKGIRRYRAAGDGGGANTVEDYAHAMIHFDTGASLAVEASWTLNIAADTTYLDLFGDRAGAALEPRLSLFGEQDDYLVDLQPVLGEPGFDLDSAFGAEVDHFVDCALNGTPCIAGAEDGVTVMRVVDAVYQSAARGTMVRLD